MPARHPWPGRWPWCRPQPTQVANLLLHVLRIWWLVLILAPFAPSRLRPCRHLRLGLWPWCRPQPAQVASILLHVLRIWRFVLILAPFAPCRLRPYRVLLHALRRPRGLSSETDTPCSPPGPSVWRSAQAAAGLRPRFAVLGLTLGASTTRAACSRRSRRPCSSST